MMLVSETAPSTTSVTWRPLDAASTCAVRKEEAAQFGVHFRLLKTKEPARSDVCDGSVPVVLGGKGRRSLDDSWFRETRPNPWG